MFRFLNRLIYFGFLRRIKYGLKAISELLVESGLDDFRRDKEQIIEAHFLYHVECFKKVELKDPFYD